MIIQSKALLDRNPKPTEIQVKEALSGNLCRCGSYQKIVASVLAAASALRGE
jgi:aerobic-type carbon monoxide dehydrogenase small subunit (CoxS/CutS family)